VNKKMMKRTYVLDTNVLLHHPGSLSSFDDQDVIVPMAVLEELDKQKGRQDEVGKNARKVSRMLDELRSTNGSLVDGVTLPTGGSLKVVPIDASVMDRLPLELKVLKTDNLIIALMVHLKSCNVDAVLVSRDINVRIKCDSLGIASEDYLKQRVTTDTGELYRGVEVADVSQDVIDDVYRGPIDSSRAQLARKPYPNQIVILKGTSGSASVITKCSSSGGGQSTLEPIQDIKSAFGLEPRNKEQRFSLDLLFDPNVNLLTLVGPSGTGKTLLALAASLDQLVGVGAHPRYNKLIVTRPVQPVGKDIGFLPGTLQEKMEPWIAPVRDNLNFLMGHQKKGSGRKSNSSGRQTTSGRDEPYLAILQDKGIIEIEAITFIRGRSIPNAIILIDEAQNLTLHELKTIVTRVGDNTKLILTGDIEQIDALHVDAFTNGLTYAVERFKEYDIAGHVTLLKGERSKLATLGSKVL
jgi:PhoH-like ATPase